MKLIVLFFVALISAGLTTSAQALEKIRAAYPAVAPGLAPLWVTAEKGIW